MVELRSIEAVKLAKSGATEKWLMVVTFEHAGRAIVKDIALVKGASTWGDIAYWLTKSYVEAWKDAQFCLHGEGWRKAAGGGPSGDALRAMVVAMQEKQPKKLLQQVLKSA